MASGDRLDHPGGDCRGEDLSTVRVAFLPTCLIMPASHAAFLVFLDRPCAGRKLSLHHAPGIPKMSFDEKREEVVKGGRRLSAASMSVENERYFLNDR